MQLISKNDMQYFVPFSQAVPDAIYEPARRIVTDFDVAPYIGTDCKKAIEALDNEDPTDKATELYAFWLNYVRPYVALAVYKRLISTHGYNIGTGGFMKTTDRQNTAAPIDVEERRQLAKSAQADVVRFLTAMERRFKDVGGTFDGTVYALDTEHYNSDKPAPAITAVGKLNPQRFNNRL